MFTCVLYSYLLAPVDESALHVEAFWIEKIRIGTALPRLGSTTLVLRICQMSLPKKLSPFSLMKFAPWI